MSFNKKLFSSDVRTKRSLIRESSRKICFDIGISVASFNRVEREIGTPDLNTFAKLLQWLNEPSAKYFSHEKFTSEYEIVTETFYRKK